jgi:hypothetical protein
VSLQREKRWLIVVMPATEDRPGDDLVHSVLLLRLLRWARELFRQQRIERLSQTG